MVNLYNSKTNALLSSFYVFDPAFRGSFTVAVADVNGDGTPDVIVGAGPGGGPQVKVFSGKDLSLLANFYAFDPNFRGGVNVAAGDLLGNGATEIVAASGPGGGPQVKVFDSNQNVLLSFYAYAAGFAGGVNVAAGDVTGDGRAAIVTAPESLGGPQVNVFDGKTGALLSSFFAYDPNFRGGLSVVVGDLYGDGKLEVVTGAGAGGGPQVNVFNADTGARLASFFAYDPNFRGGVDVAIGDLAGNGKAEIVTGPGLGGGPQVNVFDGFGNSLSSLVAFDTTFRGGVIPAVGDQDPTGQP